MEVCRTLRDLIARSRMLQDKVRRLDATIHAPVPEQPRRQPARSPSGPAQGRFERTKPDSSGTKRKKPRSKRGF